MTIFPDLTAVRPFSLDEAMALAIEAGSRVRGNTYPNPPVGAVILDSRGIPVGVAGTNPVGGAHAEPQALQMAGERAIGGTAVVTLEPCHHQGRTPPCTAALVAAGIRRVAFAVSDPNPVAAGGAQWLASQNIEVIANLAKASVADGYLRPWLHWQDVRRPHITLKTASTIDGFAAASDGSSQWITGEIARQRVHLDRSRRQAIIVGTGTVLADDPRLSARKPDGSLYDNQPLRIVMGVSDIPEQAQIRGDNFRQIRTRNPEKVVEVLADLGLIDVLVEGGPRVAGAFLEAGLVDAIECYVAPAFLGAGMPVSAATCLTTMDNITRFRTTSVTRLGDDILVTAIGNGT